MTIPGIVLLSLSMAAFIFVLFTKFKPETSKFKLNNTYTICSYIGSYVVGVVGALLIFFGLARQKQIDLGAAKTILAILSTMLLLADFYYVFIALSLKKELAIDEANTKKVKFFNITSIVAAWLLIPLLFGYLDSILSVISFPLTKFLIPFGEDKNGNPRGLTLYAVVILIGAYVAYLVADKKIVKAGYKHGIFETLLYIVFPVGIVGGRIWYVISEWESFKGASFMDIIAIWDGGLAIQGAVILGVAAGVIYMMLRHKEVPLLLAADVILPGVLLAQAIGRWGNFFNHEVYGAAQARAGWSFLPNFILNQMYVEGHPDQVYVPLFLIEGILNILGYFLITYGIGKGLKKFTVKGDLAFSYVLFYGTIRVILEPLRDPQFIMAGQADGLRMSILMSWIYIAIGIVGIVTLHVVDFLRKKKEIKNA